MPALISNLFSAINRRDWQLFVGPPYGPTSEIRIHRDEQMPVGLHESYEGLNPMQRLIEDWEEAWQEFRVEPLEVADFGDCHVIIMRYRARGAASGAEVTDTAAMLVAPPSTSTSYRLEAFWDPELALATAERVSGEPKRTLFSSGD